MQVLTSEQTSVKDLRRAGQRKQRKRMAANQETRMHHLPAPCSGVHDRQPGNTQPPALRPWAEQNFFQTRPDRPWHGAERPPNSNSEVPQPS